MEILLIAEILLTIAAWKKGWKVKALLPMGIVLSLGMIVGLLCGAASISEEGLFYLALTLDLLGLTALIFMTVSSPKKAKDKENGRLRLPAESPGN